MPFVGKYVMYDSRCAGMAKWFNRKMYTSRKWPKLQALGGVQKECRILSKGASEAANNQIESKKEKKESEDAEGLGHFKETKLAINNNNIIPTQDELTFSYKSYYRLVSGIFIAKS